MTAPVPPEGSGLHAFSLAEVAAGASEEGPSILCRSDGQALLYPRAINVVQGEPGAGKSWIGLLAVAEVVRAGERALLLDYEDCPATAAGRLLAMGATAEDLGRVLYARVAGRIEEPGRAWLAEQAPTVALVVIDSVPEALAADGLDENHAGDVSGWAARLPRPLARAGPAVLLVDHVAKSEEGRGRWARGSGAKLAVVDGAAYGLNLAIPFSRHRSGSGVLSIAKDRRGMVGALNQLAAVVRFEVADGGLRAIVLDPPGDDNPPPAKSRRLAPRDVAERLGEAGGRWASRTEAAATLGVSRASVAAVVAEAVALGLIVEEPAGGRAFAYRLPIDTEGDPPVLDLAAARRRRTSGGGGPPAS